MGFLKEFQLFELHDKLRELLRDRKCISIGLGLKRRKILHLEIEVHLKDPRKDL